MKKNIIIIAGALAFVGTGCSQFDGQSQSQSSHSELEQLVNVNTVESNSNSAHEKLKKQAVSELLSELQIVQVDGLMKKASSTQLSAKASAWGDVGSNLNTAATSSSGGGWGGSPSPKPTPESELSVKVTRDCVLGGTFTVISKPNTQLPSTNVFNEDTTPEIKTDISSSVITFNDCQVSDENLNEYTLKGSMTATTAVSKASFTAVSEGENITFVGNGTGSVSGVITILDGSNEYNCTLNLNASVNDSNGDVIVAHKSGQVSIDASLEGDFCGQQRSLSLVNTINF